MGILIPESCHEYGIPDNADNEGVAGGVNESGGQRYFVAKHCLFFRSRQRRSLIGARGKRSAALGWIRIPVEAELPAS